MDSRQSDLMTLISQYGACRWNEGGREGAYMPDKAAQRETKRGLGGHRQWKRREYLSVHGDEYAANHPAIAARFSA